jgi:hypothetical protein
MAYPEQVMMVDVEVEPMVIAEVEPMVDPEVELMADPEPVMMVVVEVEPMVIAEVEPMVDPEVELMVDPEPVMMVVVEVEPAEVITEVEVKELEGVEVITEVEVKELEAVEVKELEVAEVITEVAVVREVVDTAVDTVAVTNKIYNVNNWLALKSLQRASYLILHIPIYRFFFFLRKLPEILSPSLVYSLAGPGLWPKLPRAHLGLSHFLRSR